MLFAVLYNLLSAAGFGVWQGNTPIVDLGYARYQGVVNSRTQNTEFLGIRYAAPPTGPLRWREPQAPRPMSGLQHATTHPPICYQASIGSNSNNPAGNSSVANALNIDRPSLSTMSTSQSEDCLFLNVYSPGITTPQRLPVVVWIHGGGYVMGSASDTRFEILGFNGTYDGNDLILQAGGKVVVVMIQYRLGLFGFLSGEKVKQNGVVNAGLLDQQFALQWIQRHIGKFGGDPYKVTIWGESAGAGSVIQHLVANGGDTRPPLFRAGITSSSYLPPQYSHNHRIPEFYFNRTVELTGCKSSASLDCLRTVSDTTIQSANEQICNNAFYGNPAFYPVVDGHFIRESPTRALQKGKVNTKRILAVRNTHEAVVLVEPTVSSIYTYIRQLLPTLSVKDLEVAVSLYNSSGSVFDQASEVEGDAIFVCPTYLLSNSLSGHIFQAHFAVSPSIHTDDVRYYFPSSVPGVPPFPNPQFVNTFAQTFMDFVLQQDPNKKHDQSNILPHWPRWSRTSPIEMVFNRTGDAPDIEATTSSESLRRRCEFWASVAPSTFQ